MKIFWYGLVYRKLNFLDSVEALNWVEINGYKTWQPADDGIFNLADSILWMECFRLLDYGEPLFTSFSASLEWEQIATSFPGPLSFSSLVVQERGPGNQVEEIGGKNKSAPRENSRSQFSHDADLFFCLFFFARATD